MRSAPPPQAGRLLRVADLIGSPRRGTKALIPISRTTLFDWERRGLFPKSKALGPIKVWDEKTVLQWIAARLNGVPLDDASEALRQAANARRADAMRAHRAAKKAAAATAEAAAV